MKYLICILVSLAIMPVATAETNKGYAQGARINLSDDSYLRLLFWTQFWARAIEVNPGTTVNGHDDNWQFDLGADLLSS